MVSRRGFLGGVLALGAAGCTADTTYALFRSNFRGKTPAAGDYPLDARGIAQLPYASLGVQLGEQPRVVMILAEFEGAQLKWLSADHVAFHTRNGRLVATAGMPRDLVHTHWLTDTGEDPLSLFARDGQVPPRGVYRELALAPDDEIGVAVESNFQFAGNQDILIQGAVRHTRRLDETIVVRSWRWETRNRFWLDAGSAQVWRSVQQYCPEVAPVRLELLKAPTV